MKFTQVLRNYSFWFMDFLKGSFVKKRCKEIKNVIENSETISSETIKREYLARLLKHAVATTSFYKKESNYNSILDFPIINKNLIRDNFDEFKSSEFNKKKCHIVSTSGSTGTPFSVLQNTNKRDRNTVDNLCFLKSAGYEIGQKLIYIKIWSDDVKFSVFSKLWFQNIKPHSIFKLNSEDIKEFIENLKNDNSEKSILGYPSGFEKICRYLDEVNSEPLNCNIKAIIGMSEAINDYTYQSIKKYFGITPVSRYSNNENGVLAQQDSTSNGKFVINSASYFIEILDLINDRPVKNGELGRIVITDLHNYAMPMIRYDTGDVGVMENDDNKVSYLKTIEGRKLDLLYDIKGNVVPSHVSYKLCKYGNYKQFQLIQFGKKEYLIKLNTETKVDEERMLEEYKGYFGYNAIISIKYVNEIPLLSSGKRREVRNTYHSQL